MERPLLLPFVPLYRLGLVLDRWRRGRGAYRSPRPVISVGSITAGGAGKTPLVRWLAESIQQQAPVIILSRGYGRRSTEPLIWRAGDSPPDPAEFGDEPAMLARTLTNGLIAVGSDRRALLQSLDARGVKGIALLDDGFQHWSLARDLDLVLVSNETFRTGLLPAGNRREPLAALRRADAIISYESEALETARQMVGEGVPTIRLEYFLEGIRSVDGGWIEPSEPVVLVTGVARPERVLAAVEGRGIEVAQHLVFRDHVDYTPAVIGEIEQGRRERGVKWVLTTEKDAVKLQWRIDNVLWMQMGLRGEEQESLRHLINPLLQKK